MQKVIKISALVLGMLLVLVLCLVMYVHLAFPNVGPASTDLQVAITPEKVERGKYLAHHVMMCVDCHSKRDFSLFSAPPIPGTENAGGEVFDYSMGFPGRFVSPNITPFGIGEYTDGELYRLITTGVKRDGQAIFPVMPYPWYGQMDPEDIESVIAYVRSLEPVEKVNDASKADFPFSLILKTIPQEAQPRKRPGKDDPVAYGEYLVTASACKDCHTSFEGGKFTGEWLAGGREFQMPDGAILRTPNLTPDKTGLAHWTSEMFVRKFKMYEEPENQQIKVMPGQMQTIMPWVMYAGMEEDDLKAIYAYLMSLSPVENQVIRFSPKDKR